jgi:hypothetical protein
MTWAFFTKKFTILQIPEMLVGTLPLSQQSDSNK